MKKYISFYLISLFCTLGLVSNAQETIPFDRFSNGDIIWIVKTGLSLNNVSGSGVDDAKATWAAQNSYGKYKNTFGGSLSFGLYTPLGSKGPLYIGSSFAVDKRGFNESIKWKEVSDINAQSTKLNAFMFEIAPCNIGCIANVGENIALDFHIGAMFTVDIFGSLKSEIEYLDKPKLSESINIDDVEGYNKYDAALLGGIGVWYKHWGVELNYQRGLSSIRKNEDYFSKKILISLGYAF